MLTTPIGAKVKRQATTTFIPKTVINANLLQSTPPTSTYCTTLIDPATVTYFNCGKNNYFTLSCLELKNINNIKEIEKEEEETSNKLKKEEP